jgi:hypothetical protein
VTKSELVKVILFLLCAFTCAMGVMDYLASTANPWRATFWIGVFALGFLVFVFFLCRVLALFMLRFEGRKEDDLESTVLMPKRRKETGDI